MSLNKIASYSLVILISAGIGYAGNFYFHELTKSEQVLNLSSHQKPFLQGKNQDTVLVNIDTPQLPKNDKDEVIIIGYLQAQLESTEPVRYQWILPNDVQILEGDVLGEFSSEEAMKIQTVKLRVSGFSLEQRKIISLQVDTALRNQAVGNSYSISSQPSETWEYYAKEMKKNKDEFVANNAAEDSAAKEVKIIK